MVSEASREASHSPPVSLLHALHRFRDSDLKSSRGYLQHGQAYGNNGLMEGCRNALQPSGIAFAPSHQRSSQQSAPSRGTGVDLRTVKEWLGHSDMEYDHALSQAVAEPASAVIRGAQECAPS